MNDSRPRDDHDGLSRRGWIVLVVATSAVAVLAVGAAAFSLGLPWHPAAASPASPAEASAAHSPALDPAPAPLGLPPRPTTAPTPVATVPERPVAALAAGDCLQTYSSKSADAYPVIDCASPHIAQVLSEGRLPQSSSAAFPGTEALEKQISDLCQQHLDWDWVRVWNEDVQLDLRYPDTAASWAAGNRTYYCFVTTVSRHELTGTAVAG